LKEKFSFAMRAVLDQKTIRLFAGVRPLIGDTEIHNSRNVSRDFRIIESPVGLFSIIGGKLTTARFMAETAVNMIAQRIGNSSPCMTSVTPIHLGNGN